MGRQLKGVLVEKRGKRGTVLIPELDLDVQVHLRRDLPLDSRILLTPDAVNLAKLAVHAQVAE
jgi:hypothetical protein